MGLAAAKLPAPSSTALRRATPSRPPLMLAAPQQPKLVSRSCDCGAAARLSGRCEACDHTALAPAQRPAESRPPPLASPTRDRPPLDQAITASPAAHNLGQLRIDPAGPARAARLPLQTRLRVSTPGDAAEQEAEQIGARVVRMDNPALARGDPRPLRREAPYAVQRRAIQPTRVTPAVARGVEESRGSGAPLPQSVRAFMEPRFGADFANVLVHTGSEAAALNTQLNAHAFTAGRDVYFNAGQFRPETQEGRELIAHELAHTIQQGGVIQRAAEPSVTAIQQGSGLQRKAATPSGQTEAAASPSQQASAAAALRGLETSSQVVDVSTNAFSPSQQVQDEIEAQGPKGLDVRVIAKGLTSEGRVKVRSTKSKTFDSLSTAAMPLLNPWTQQLGGMFVNFSVSNSRLKSGYASLKPHGADTNDWLRAIQKESSLLGGMGLKVENLPRPVNSFDDGKLTLGVTDLKVEVGGFLDARVNFLLENLAKPKIDAKADVNIKGAAKGELKLDNTAGNLTGQVALAVAYASFTGAANIKYNADGSVDVGGRAAYNANKLSGEIQFVSTDVDSADKFAKDAIAAAGGLQNVQEAAAPPPVPAPKASQKRRALAATGQLAFNLTHWFAGTVNVVVDGKGAVTVIGRIAPPAEINLFDQKDWDKELIKFEAKAYYGIPVVGDLNLFANISLHALAKLGPAKFYNIEILGTYSTDPAIQKNIQISGSINISAYGGLRLRAEGGAGVEIVEHEIKFGIGLNADVGVKAYADARPTIGYRDPGVFYISGVLELIAQPVLGLGGDFFIALEAPWWSPLSDDRWTWPLFSKEWPLTDPIGISAAVKDYELGSGNVPEIELKPPEFDPSKFMTSMVDKTLPDKSAGAGAGQGTFKEDGTVQKPIVPPKKPAPKQVVSKPPKKGAPLKSGKSASRDPKAAKEQQNAKILQAAARRLTALKNKGALTRADLNHELATIRAQASGVDFDVKPKETRWLVTPSAGGKTGKGIEFAAKEVRGTDKDKNTGDVRTRAAAAVQRRLSGEHARSDIPGILQGILRELSTEGLKTLDLGSREPDGSAFILAEASPKLPILKLLPKGLLPRGVSVKMAARIRLAKPIAADVITPIPAVQEVGPARGSVRLGQGRFGAAILPPPSKEADGSTEIVAAWNTDSLSLNASSNSTHAEHQFATAMRARGDDYLGKIDAIDININLSACTMCSDDLAALARQIETARKRFNVEEGRSSRPPLVLTLSWGRLYLGGPASRHIATSQASVGQLSRAGWRLSAPSDQRPEVVSAWLDTMHIEPLEQATR